MVREIIHARICLYEYANQQVCSLRILQNNLISIFSVDIGVKVNVDPLKLSTAGSRTHCLSVVYSMPEPGNLNALVYGPPLAIRSLYQLALAWLLTLAIGSDGNNLTQFKSLSLGKE